MFQHVVETAGLAARQAAAAVGQSQLMQAWDKVFYVHGMPTAQVLLTRDDLRARRRFLNARNTFAELLEWGVLPIVNENDTVSISELKFGDNDCLSSLLVNLTGADLFINLTSACGVLSADPQKNPDAAILDHIDDVAALDLGQLCGGKTSVGTGGMDDEARSKKMKSGLEKAPHRSLLYALGLTREEMDRPLVGIVNAASEVVPGHMLRG